MMKKLRKNNYNYYKDKCRACLKKGDMSIINNKASKVIIEAIRTFADIEITELDGMPHHLCRKCYSLLESGIKFRKMIQKSDELLRKLKSEASESESSLPNDGYSSDHYFEENLPEVLENPDIKAEFVSEIPLDNDEDSINICNSIPSKKTSKKVNCQYCGKDVGKYYYKNHLALHKQNIPKDTPTKVENEDIKLYDTNKVEPSDELQSSVQAEDSDNAEKKNKVKCEVCDKDVSKNYYKYHLSTHKQSGRTHAECKICKKTMLKYCLKKHLSVFHSKKTNFACHVCGKAFKYHSSYYMHLKTHTDDFPFKCQQCPYRGRCGMALRTHMQNTHIREYKYPCPVCPAKFLSTGNRNKHMVRHQEKKFKCDSCSQAYYTQPQLERHHEVIHMGIKAHVCDICEQSFGYKRGLRAHKQRVHNAVKNKPGHIPSYLEAERKKQESSSEYFNSYN
ncbi:hypothetical protein JYU34_019412 [Plutella xylostella]|uniref:Uncharacterized protein n=1 Tax=Plutella xylostella TaxID=51655 RepID=A0ABQ7PX04_PLUXY|nr:hypothetical protein JYU34_019412 [Plutella xylostella]